MRPVNFGLNNIFKLAFGNEVSPIIRILELNALVIHTMERLQHFFLSFVDPDVRWSKFYFIPWLRSEEATSICSAR